MTRTFFAGLDLGRRHDYSALAVVERLEEEGAAPALRVRYVERIALGTEYREIVARVKQVMDALEAEGGLHLAVDATGLGGPIVEQLGRAGMAGRLWPVSITGGKAEGYEGGFYRTPKRDLVMGLQVLVEQGSLQMAEGLGERATLVQEMSEMRLKTTPSGREQYEAGTSGQHDDLVSALSLACWVEKKTGG